MPLRLLVPFFLIALAVACGGNGESPADSSPEPGACQPPSGGAPEPAVKSYPERPPLTIDPMKSYRAIVNTVRGQFTIELRPDLAPETVNSFVFLAREGFFDGVTFHRVIPGFVAQAGDPTGAGSGGPGYTIPAEFSDAPYERGVVGMARTVDPDSGGSQWFITYTSAPELNGQYTVFGQVTEGMDVVDCLTARDPAFNPDAPPGDAITGIEIKEG